ncbi:MAG: GIY-YIG nuclease family protein [Hyphomicrobiales bacterium]|nr:GIY-YIG nuclease family protein [Hyphomicrobiales bacterium]
MAKCGKAAKGEAALILPAAFAAVPFHKDAGALPAQGGAYVLLIDLAAPLAVELRGDRSVLAAGRYLYCGSAYGPGGIRARVGRHMRRDKTIRWHVDRLTVAGCVVGVWVFPGGKECTLVRALADCPAPIPGFGSSDCRVCESHLLAWPPGGNEGKVLLS